MKKESELRQEFIRGLGKIRFTLDPLDVNLTKMQFTLIKRMKEEGPQQPGDPVEITERYVSRNPEREYGEIAITIRKHAPSLSGMNYEALLTVADKKGEVVSTFPLRTPATWPHICQFVDSTPSGDEKDFFSVCKAYALWFDHKICHGIGLVYTATYGRIRYGSLAEAVEELRKMPYGGMKGYHLQNIVQYNVRYRDCLRAEGMDGLLDRLLKDAPALAEIPTVLGELYDWWEKDMNQQIADYDIRCLPRDGLMEIEGTSFFGLEQILERVEISGHTNYWSEYEEQRKNVWAAHVGREWESYPMFDSSDWGDNRSYDNFIIRRHPVTVADMEALCKIPSRINYCRVHEHIPEELLPVLYCNGDSSYVLLATKK